MTLTQVQAASILGDRDRVRDALQHIHEGALDARNAHLLRTCLLRLAELLGEAERDPDEVSATPTEAEVSALAFVEQWVVDVASMPRSLVNDLSAHIGNDHVLSFLQAILVFEQRLRLGIAWRQLGLLSRAPFLTERDLPQSGPAPSLGRALSEWQAAVVCLDRVDPVTTELVRLRCANYHDCHT